jgi:4-hydroxy-tetrahydrodipicolinate reductase
MNRIKLAVHGAAGRMGRRVIDLAAKDREFQIVAAIEAAGSPHLGRDAGQIAGTSDLGVPLSENWKVTPDVAIDFSTAAASVTFARHCHAHGVPVVIATTGHSERQRQEILELHHEVPVLISANMSLVVNVLMKLTAIAGGILKGRDFDVEIVERHHRFKADAPSGTALKFAEIVEHEMGLEHRKYGREGLTGERPRNELGLHAIRTGDNVGEHAIIFSAIGETMELVHKGTSRDSYAAGALEAARFLSSRKPGLYSMADVLGL